MNKSFEVVVAGAGIVGLTVAALLARTARDGDLRITLIDAAKRPNDASDTDVDLRVSAMSMGSVALLEELGAWPIVAAARLCAYDHMRVWDQATSPNGPSTLRFDADEFAVPHLGYIVENCLLQQALLSVLDESDATLHFAEPLESVERIGNGWEVVFDSGDRLYADLVIAADGARSRVRECAGIKMNVHAYEQTAFVTHVRPEEPHDNTAWQRFLVQGPIGLLPLADGRLSVVWTTTPDAARHAVECGDGELGRILSEASGYVLGALRVSGPRGTFRLAAQHAEHYVRHGIALVGDAAHTIHPLAGQGANLGLADAAVLAGVLRQSLDNGEHPADKPVLRRYERARKGENSVMLHFMTGLNRLFASDSVLLGQLRRAGMALFNRSGPIRTRVVRVALGGNRR